MLPKVPSEILDKLRAASQAPPWKCKLQLHRGRTVYGVEINADGEITNVGRRSILDSFDPPLINRFFPAYAEEIRQRLREAG